MDNINGTNLTLSVDEFPMLENVKPKTKIKIRADGIVDLVDGNSVNIVFDSFDIETENKADKSLKELSKNYDYSLQEMDSTGKGDDSF